MGAYVYKDVYWRAIILLKHSKIRLLCLENVPGKCRRRWLQKTTSFQDQMNGRILGFFFDRFSSKLYALAIYPVLLLFTAVYTQGLPTLQDTKGFRTAVY